MKHVFKYSGGAGSFGMVERMLPQIDRPEWAEWMEALTLV